MILKAGSKGITDGFEQIAKTTNDAEVKKLLKEVLECDDLKPNSNYMKREIRFYKHEYCVRLLAYHLKKKLNRNVIFMTAAVAYEKVLIMEYFILTIN